MGRARFLMEKWGSSSGSCEEMEELIIKGIAVDTDASVAILVSTTPVNTADLVCEACSNAVYSVRSRSGSYNEEWNCDNYNATNHHQTESCASHKQMTREPPQDSWITSSDEFCEFCSETGHDTFTCPSYQLRRKNPTKTSG
ncbi:hypothetical protein Y032_0003g1669 [Ancylostoma ceylanicum]|uniref:Uncharacterized protein n=1 Tax=Ancylostoma ceylanicum TaxID=53326 RepID=A0A016W0S9_9BILA|nr:hypothetical protein Y032_0003g1669 [Ancylostoma ceylanicum]